MNLDIILLLIMIIAAIWAVVARSLLKAAIGLAIVSVIITMFMFKFNSPLAGVFELSVCTGLITVIFLSTIGLTKPMTNKQIQESLKKRARRYGLLPVLVVLAGSLAVGLLNLPLGLKLAEKAAELDVRNVLWNLRHLDLFGQIIILLAGGFGAVILFKEIKEDEW
jgi:NADH-quinone oxidoreductase subunit J